MIHERAGVAVVCVEEACSRDAMTDGPVTGSPDPDGPLRLAFPGLCPRPRQGAALGTRRDSMTHERAGLVVACVYETSSRDAMSDGRVARSVPHLSLSPHDRFCAARCSPDSAEASSA